MKKRELMAENEHLHKLVAKLERDLKAAGSWRVLFPDINLCPGDTLAVVCTLTMGPEA